MTVGLGAEMVPVYHDLRSSEVYLQESGIPKSLRYKFICEDENGKPFFTGKIHPQNILFK